MKDKRLSFYIRMISICFMLILFFIPCILLNAAKTKKSHSSDPEIPTNGVVHGRLPFQNIKLTRHYFTAI